MAIAVIAGLSGLAWMFAPAAEGGDAPFLWYSILPPLLAVSLALVTERIMPSLAIAVLAGGLLATVPDAPNSLLAWGGGIDTGFSFVARSIGDSFNLQILIFVVFILSMVNVIIVAGGLHGIVLWLSRFARGPRSAQFVTYLMGLVVFIDDYANTMIVGASMRPATDKFRVSREKLAFLVDSTSAPVAGLAVISTWVGYEVGLFNETGEALGFNRTGYAILFDAIVFRFYCVLMLVFVAVNIVSGKDYGPMRRAERRCRETGAVAEPDAVPMTSDAFSTSEPAAGARVRAMTGVIPLVGLFAFLIAGIWVDGGGVAALRTDPGGVLSFTVWRDVISASENSVKLLAYGSALGLLVAAACARVLGGLDRPTIVAAAKSGARSSALPIIILTLAWSLKEACTALGTGPFLVALVGDSLNPALFPAVIFVVAGLTSFATGTSYGTMAILMPTAVPIAYALEGDVYGLVTIVTLASILDGSIVGDHCSPISDTTIMSSISSSSDHIHHVRTQMPYSLTVAGIALLCGYIPAGFGLPSWVCFGLGVTVIGVGYVFLTGHREQVS